MNKPKVDFLAERNDRTNRWTASAWIGSKKIAQTPDNFPTKREALKAIKERV